MSVDRPVTVEVPEGSLPEWERVKEKLYLNTGTSPEGWPEDPDVAVLRYLLAVFQWTFPVAEGDCRHCRRPIALQLDGYCHLRPVAKSTGTGWSSVGCYSASFDWLGGDWDEALDRRLKATP